MFFVIAALAAQAQGSGKPPQPLFGGTWMTDDDYPAEERRLGHAGTVGWELRIDRSGIPTGCEVLQSSGFPTLDQATCEIVVRRLRFKPARDEGGKAIEGRFKGRFTWQLPQSARSGTLAKGHAVQPITNPGLWLTLNDFTSFLRDYPQTLFAFEMEVGVDGRVSECTITTSSGSTEVDRLACILLRRRAKFVPAHDADGKPVASPYKGRFSWGNPPANSHMANDRRPLILDLTVASLPSSYVRPAQLKVHVGIDATIQDCTVEQTSGSTAVDRAACQQVRQMPVSSGDGRLKSGADATVVVSFRADTPAKP